MLLKKIALLVFFSFSISSIITDIEYYTQEESQYEKIIKNITYYNTSNNKLEKNKLEIYYDNGQLKIEQNYSNNQKHGDYKEYFRDGQIKTEGEYSFDKKEKQWNMYYKYTGVLESKKFYENNSIYKAYYYDKNGKKIDYTNLQDKGIFLNTFEFGCEEISGQAYIKFYNNKIAKSWYNNNFKIINDKIILTKENNVTCEDFSYKTKNYSAEAQLLLKDVAGASEMYEAMHGGQQTTLDELESRAFIGVTDAQKRKWKVEISGDMFIATSSDEMDGGAGHEVRYDRATGEFSGYGIKEHDYNCHIEEWIWYWENGELILNRPDTNDLNYNWRDWALCEDNFINFDYNLVLKIKWDEEDIKDLNLDPTKEHYTTYYFWFDQNNMDNTKGVIDAFTDQTYDGTTALKFYKK